ncbi:MAG: MBL fold metallo-hydrolase [Syntrophales bacterium]|nr:MBL fold metallo-hydrolase [Syntrophales bacterium]MDD5233353.1 MBL fold metallo-hydrolase [Syntrophales bacterium]MDD5532898.1 MBL fold metallo-hydrolase [Syntrophales bacterium]
MIRVTILGSGTGVPSLERSACSVLMRTGSRKLLFDLGAGTMRRLLEAGVSIWEITHVFISHHHPDHTGELASFLFATKYPEEYRRRTAFTVAGAEGLLRLYDGLRQAFGNWIEMEEILHFREFSTAGPDVMEDEEFETETLPMRHIESSVGYRVTARDGSVAVYSGDTDYSDNLIELARNADLLICESSLPDEIKAEGHLTPSIAGTIATRADVKTLLLTHFYPESDRFDIESECRQTYAGPLIFARDLMELDVFPGRVM